MKQSVITRLTLHMANPYTEFEVSTSAAHPEIFYAV